MNRRKRDFPVYGAGAGGNLRGDDERVAVFVRRPIADQAALEQAALDALGGDPGDQKRLLMAAIDLAEGRPVKPWKRKAPPGADAIRAYTGQGPRKPEETADATTA